MISEMLSRFVNELEVYGVEVPVSVGEHASVIAARGLGLADRAGIDESIIDYWRGNLTVFGIL